MMRARNALLAGLALAVAAAPADAQWRNRAPGWIGISFDVSSDRRGRNTRVEVTEVVSGSPAAEAGVRVGDRLLAVNDLDRPSELSELSERLRLRAGDRVRMVVQRDGRRRELRMRAAERPVDFEPTREVWVSVEADSMVETMVRAMDSMRVRIIRDQGSNVGVVAPARGSGATVAVRASSGTTTVRAPFEFFVFRGEEHDSLRQEMNELNRTVRELERRRAERRLELRSSLGPVSQVRMGQDAELDRLERALERAERQSVSLKAAMADAARETAGFEYTTTRAARAPEPTTVEADVRPLAPYLLGRNRVAGAEVIDLRSELASYFDGVEGGVLVVDVAPRTPAAISGILPGDVITRMDQVAVRSVEDLRFGVSQAGTTLPLTLIRKGSSIQVLLRR